MLPKIGAKAADWWDEDRWNKELAEDLEPVMNDICDAHGKETAEDLGTEYDTGITRNYLKAMALGRAKATNAVTYDKLKRAKAEYDPEDEESVSPADVMEKRAETRRQPCWADLSPRLLQAGQSWRLASRHSAAALHAPSRRNGHTGANPRPSTPR